MSSDLPHGWKHLALEGVATLQRGFDLPLDSRKEGEVPVYGSNGIDGWHDRAMVKGPGVVTGRSGTIGFVHYEDRDFWPLNTTLYVCNFHGNSVSFVARLLEFIDLKRFSASTGVPSLNRNFVHPTRVLVPPTDEQKQISDIIHAVDDAIANTDALIRKLKAMKQGLLNDLLTRGLDENGKLRYPQMHPEQFKKTDIGWLPSLWHVQRIEEIKADSPNALSMGPFGSNITVRNFTSEGVPVIRGINLGGPIIDFSNAVFISDKKANELHSSNVFWNDIVITHRGTIGQVSLFKANSPYERAVISQSQLKISCNKSIISPLFLTIYFTSEPGQKLINNAKGHTGVQAISQPLSSVRKMKIPVPPLREQQRIESTVLEWDEQINKEEVYYNKLAEIKQGLMHDLLTGKVRVKTDTLEEKTVL